MNDASQPAESRAALALWPAEMPTYHFKPEWESDPFVFRDWLLQAARAPADEILGRKLRDWHRNQQKIRLGEVLDRCFAAAAARHSTGFLLASLEDAPEPSVLSHELLDSAVYTFLDDAPLEERRTRAVYTRRATELRDADDLGALDPAAIERVRREAWPVANTADEMYDALMVAGYIRESELAPHWRALLDQLGDRAVKKDDAWFAHERENDDPVEIFASRMEVLGPIASKENEILLALEVQGDGVGDRAGVTV